MSTRYLSSRHLQVVLVLAVFATAAMPFLGEALFPTTGLASQGAVFNWDPYLLLLHLISDVSIGLAYVAISLTLIIFAHRAGKRVPFLWAFVAFGVFIISCGLTHFMAAVTLWEPVYWVAGGVKYVTALASVGTAIAVPPLVPRALTLVEEARVSDQRREQLQESHAELERQASLLAQLATIVESAQDAIASRDRDYRITSWNPGAEQLYGYPAEEIIGEPFTRLVPRDRLSEFYEIEAKVVRGEAVAPRQTARLRKDGRRVDVSESTTAVRSPDGQIMGVASIARDISEELRAEAVLLRAQRLETAGRIASQVAHDFNNLLAPLSGYPELIKLQLAPDHPAVRYCDQMLLAARRMAEINTDLLTLGRRGHFVQAPVSLNQVVEEALRSQPRVPDTLKLEVRLAQDLLLARGAAAQILRVVTNLIQNARDAMQDNGRLTIVTDNVYLDQPLRRYNDLAVGEYVRLEVADEGSGISPEIQDRIFDVFFTTKTTDQQRGSGLGLSVVQTVVADHQGYVDFTSAPGEGSSFSIYLPATRDMGEPQEFGTLQPGTESILVVDDDGSQRRVLTDFLNTLGYQVDTAESGEDAVEKVAQRSYDLVILDMVMPPGIDGAETFARLRAQRSELRAILLSGFADSDRVSAAQGRGAGAFLGKPVSLGQLSTAVRDELDHRSSDQRQGAPC